MRQVEWKQRVSSGTTCVASGGAEPGRLKISRLGSFSLALLLAVTLAACSPSLEKISQKVLVSMQHRFATDPELSQLGVSITKVVVIKEAGNKYQGMATVQYKGAERQVPVQVTAEGENVIWKTEPGAFMFVVQHELQRALGQSQ